VVNYDDMIVKNNSSIVIKLVDFVVGFECGYIIRCRYINNVDVKDSYKKNQYFVDKKLTIMNKLNRCYDFDEGVT
jgi:hypothetical protein